MTFLEARGLAKIYSDMAKPVSVLNGLSFSMDAGQCIGIYGASGSGKSTLLHLLGGLDTPTEGEVLADGMKLDGLSDQELADFRNRKIGFVFQFYYLLPEFTALENVMMPVLIAGGRKREAGERASEALRSVGLGDRLKHRPSMLSGGEQQRVALARATIMEPQLILADEPTGNLDSASGEMVWNYIMELNRKNGMAVIIVTHNKDLIRCLDVVYELTGGVLKKMDHIRGT